MYMSGFEDSIIVRCDQRSEFTADYDSIRVEKNPGCVCVCVCMSRISDGFSQPFLVAQN